MRWGDDNMNSILIVEDDKILNRGVSFALKREGYDVISAYSKIEGKEIILNNENEIDFLLLDINLSDGSGLELCKEVREKVNFPIVFLQQTIQKKIWSKVLKLDVMIIYQSLLL